MTSSRPRSLAERRRRRRRTGDGGRRCRCPSPGCRTSTAPSEAQRLGERLEGGQRLLPAAAEQDAGAGVEDLAGEAVRQPRLADAGLARDQDDAAAAVQRDVGPGRAEALELRRAADERGLVLAGERGRRRRTSGGRRSASSSARVSRDGAIASVVRSRSAKRSPATQRRGAVARVREALDQAPVGLLGERVERHLLARQPHRLGRVARRRGELLERLGEPLAVGAARLVRPVVVEAVEDLGRDRPARRPPGRRGAAPRRTGARRRRASSATVSRVATSCAAAGPSARRSSLNAARRLVRAESSRTSGQKRAASCGAACGPGCSAR